MNTEQEKDRMRLKQRICDALKTLPHISKDKWELAIKDNMVTLATCEDQVKLCQALEHVIRHQLENHCKAWAIKEGETI